MLAKKISIFRILFFIAKFKRKHVTKWRSTICLSCLMYLVYPHTSVVCFFIECSAYVLAYFKLFRDNHFAYFFTVHNSLLYQHSFSNFTANGLIILNISFKLLCNFIKFDIHYFLEAHTLNSNRRSVEIRFNFFSMFVKRLTNRES